MPLHGPSSSLNAIKLGIHFTKKSVNNLTISYENQQKSFISDKKNYLKMFSYLR